MNVVLLVILPYVDMPAAGRLRVFLAKPHKPAYRRQGAKGLLVLALAISQNHPKIPLTPFEKGESHLIAFQTLSIEYDFELQICT